MFKLRNNLRSRVHSSFKQEYTPKAKKSYDMIGCTYSELCMYLESQFTPEMNWYNYGEYWEIDHKIPVSWARNPEELEMLHHYTNLQPLSKTENMEKGNRRSDF